MISIIPSPHKVHKLNGTIDANSIQLPQECPFETYVMMELWNDTRKKTDGDKIPLVFKHTSEIGDEAYILTITENKIEISYSAPCGAYYGFVTFTELIKNNSSNLPCVEINDFPVMPVRCVTDDISRGQVPSLSAFKSIIKRLSILKYNLYMPYIEDTFRFESQPDIGKYSDSVPPNEWKEIIKYANSHFVSVRPIFNTLGHWDKMAPLAKYRDLILKPPENTKYPVPQVLNPEHPQVRPLLAELLQELIQTFGTGLVHVGGDEPLHLTEVFGHEKATELYISHYTWLYDKLTKFGCTMAMYSDVFTPVWGKYAVGVDAIKKMPRNIRMVYWNYNPDSEYSELTDLLKFGFETYISPSTHNCKRLAPNLPKVYTNTKKIVAKAGGNSAGIMMSNWGDGTDCTIEMAWPAYAIASEFAWSNQPQPYKQLLDIFFTSFFGLNSTFDFSRIAPIYETDKLFELVTPGEGRQELWRAFWQDARKVPDINLRNKAGYALEVISDVLHYLDSATPHLNVESWRCIHHSAERLAFICKKLLIQKPCPYASREEAKILVPHILELERECRNLLEVARKRWFASNRLSEWKLLEAKYLDLADSIASLARYSNEYVHFAGNEKFLLTE